MLVVAALFQPVCGVVFALDGVLIGAGDGRYLAWAGVVTLLRVPAAGAGWCWPPTAGWSRCGGRSTRFMLARLVTLVVRWRGERWLVTGAAVPRRT